VQSVPSIPKEVEKVFHTYPVFVQRQLFKIRKLIFEVASEIGGVCETLKWQEPSYLPLKKGVGTTVRLAWKSSKPKQYGMYVNCKTSLISQIRRKFPGVFQLEGKRGIIFNEKDPLALDQIKQCIEMALTYHVK
jgi:hypothetical protein